MAVKLFPLLLLSRRRLLPSPHRRRLYLLASELRLYLPLCSPLCYRFLDGLFGTSFFFFIPSVFADLQPYICTFEDCELETAQFPSRTAWAEHEFSKHRIELSWNCPECPKKCGTAIGWEQHLREDHHRNFSGLNLKVALQTAQSAQNRPIEQEECPLCRIVLGKPRRAFVKHVGRHMEEIALLALPRGAEDDLSEGSSGTNETSLDDGTHPTKGPLARNVSKSSHAYDHAPINLKQPDDVSVFLLSSCLTV